MLVPEAPRGDEEVFKWRMLLVDYLKKLRTVITKAADYTLPANDHLVFADATTTGFTITLPPITGTIGVKMIIKRIDTNSGNDVIIDGNGADIDGSSTNTLSNGLDYRTVVSDGINWYLVG